MAILPFFLLLTGVRPISVAEVSALAGVHGRSVLHADAGVLVIVGLTAGGFVVSGVSIITCVHVGSIRLCGCWHSCNCWKHCWRLPASLLLPVSVAVLCVLAAAGVLVIVGRPAGGFAVAGVSAIACVCGGSVCLCGCWHSCYF